MQVTFLRHAESEYNANPDSTTVDCGLTAKGECQAKNILFPNKFDFAIISPLRRAQQTFMLLSERPQTFEIWDLVREKREVPCDFLHGETLNFETQDELSQRVDRFIEKIQKNKYKNILVVSHCEFITEVTGWGLKNAEHTTITI